MTARARLVGDASLAEAPYELLSMSLRWDASRRRTRWRMEHAASTDAASGFARESHSNTRANAVLTDVAPNMPTVGSDDVLAEVQADARAFAIFGIHPAVMFNAEELLEDALAKLRWDARAGICHGKMQD